MVRVWTLIAAVGGALFLGYPGKSHANVASASLTDNGRHFDITAPRRAQPWWVGFNDETLNQLIDAAHLQSKALRSARPLNALPLEAGIVAAYVSIKVHSLQLIYLENERAAVARQRKLMIASQPQHDDFIKELSRRQDEADDSIRKVKTLQEATVALLADQCGISKADLISAIADVPTDRLRALPKFSSPVPRALPTALLANRDDIHLAAALYGIDPVASLAGLDKSTGEVESAETQGNRRGTSFYFNVVAQAHAEVSAALSYLQTQSDTVGRAYREALSARARFEASTARRDRGEMSEVILMEDFQAMLQSLHALAIANGDLAMAWVILIARLGNGTSLDADLAPRSAATRVLPKVSQNPREP